MNKQIMGTPEYYKLGEKALREKEVDNALEIMYGNPDAYKRGYEQGKKDADKLTEKEVNEIKQFCFKDGFDSGRIATLEEVQKEVKLLGYAGNSDIVKWLEQQLKEAKG